MKLNELKLYEEGIINKVKADDNIKRRLMDIGFSKGSMVKPIFENQSMRAYLVKGTVIAVRLEDSKDIEINI